MVIPCGCGNETHVDVVRSAAASDEQQVMMVVEVGLVAAMLDDAIPEDESAALATAIRLLPGLRGISDEQLNVLLSIAGQRTSHGDAWLCEVSMRLTHPALRRVAFRMASMFCAWDGVIDEKEQGYLDFLAKAFGYSPAEASALFAQATGNYGDAQAIAPTLNQSNVVAKREAVVDTPGSGFHGAGGYRGVTRAVVDEAAEFMESADAG